MWHTACAGMRGSGARRLGQRDKGSVSCQERAARVLGGECCNGKGTRGVGEGSPCVLCRGRLITGRTRLLSERKFWQRSLLRKSLHACNHACNLASHPASPFLKPSPFSKDASGPQKGGEKETVRFTPPRRRQYTSPPSSSTSLVDAKLTSRCASISATKTTSSDAPASTLRACVPACAVPAGGSTTASCGHCMRTALCESTHPW